MIGTRFSHFEILEELGRGGMGVVCKARDVRLDRLVALKFLPAHLSAGREENKRFVREARAASALDHPNICTIYEIGETDDGRQFIAMAFYDGKPLNVIVESGPLPVETAFDYARQVAGGLARAHEAGIVHRDIKPGNVIITDRGVAKIVDFGLAKTEGESVITRQSSTVGTVSYMSPEQSRGEATDHRVDVWALGVMLYEMLSGERPFRGSYEQAIIYSILNEDPPSLTEARPELTPGQIRIVEKCLLKDPADRFSDMDGLIAEVDGLKELQVSATPTAAPDSVRRYVWPVIAIVFVVALVALLLSRRGDRLPVVTATARVTGFPGVETHPSYAPDLTRIVYASDRNGNYDIWLHDIGSQRDVNLTADYEGLDFSPAWSPDGLSIAFHSDRQGGGIFVVDVDGGAVRPVATSLSSINPQSGLSWSRDGSTLLFGTPLEIYTVPAAGGPLQLLPVPSHIQLIALGQVVWSHDGARILFVAEAGSGLTTAQIWSIRPDGTDPIPLTDAGSYNRSPAMAPDGRGLYFISDRDGTADLWYTKLDEAGRTAGIPSRLTTGAGISILSISPDGDRAVYSDESERTNLWAVPLGETPATLDGARQMTNEDSVIELMDLSPDGEWLAFDLIRSGHADIWTMRISDLETTRLTTDPAHDWAPSWTPGMQHILFHSTRSGNRDIWRVPAGGGEPESIMRSPNQEYTPRLSPDGTQMVIGRSLSVGYDFWIADPDGENPRRLTNLGNLWWYPVWSASGAEIAFATNITGEAELYAIPATGGSIRRITDFGWYYAFPIRWSRDGSTVYVCGTDGPDGKTMELWAVDAETGAVRPLTDFSGTSLTLTNGDTDGETFYGVFLERTGDLWEMELSEQ